MSITAFLVSAFLEAVVPGPKLLACTFPAADPGQNPIGVRVEAMPSLKDRTDRYRIRIYLDDESEFRGLAQPIDKTDDRDVLIRARAAGQLFYTIGLRDDGKAALNLLEVRPQKTPERQETRAGTCRDFEGYLDSWLSH